MPLQRHDGGQVAEFLTEQEGIEFPLHDDQRAAGLDDVAGGKDSRPVAERFGVLRLPPSGRRIFTRASRSPSNHGMTTPRAW